MAGRSRRDHSAAFQAKVAIAAVERDVTVAELAEWFDIHLNLITQWTLLENAAAVFNDSKSFSEGHDIEEPHAKSAHLVLGNDCLAGIRRDDVSGRLFATMFKFDLFERTFDVRVGFRIERTGARP